MTKNTINIEVEFIDSEIVMSVNSKNCSPIMVALAMEQGIRSLKHHANKAFQEVKRQQSENDPLLKEIFNSESPFVKEICNEIEEEAFDESMDEIKKIYKSVKFNYENSCEK